VSAVEGAWDGDWCETCPDAVTDPHPNCRGHAEPSDDDRAGWEHDPAADRTAHAG
jgi:hypothetical protein